MHAAVCLSVLILQLSNYSTNFHKDAINIMPLEAIPASYFLTYAVCNNNKVYAQILNVLR